jgi:hypothetical protein
LASFLFNPARNTIKRQINDPILNASGTMMQANLDALPIFAVGAVYRGRNVAWRRKRGRNGMDRLIMEWSEQKSR